MSNSSTKLKILLFSLTGHINYLEKYIMKLIRTIGEVEVVEDVYNKYIIYIMILHLFIKI